MTRVVVGVGLLAAVAAGAYGWGGAPVLLAALVAAGWMAPVPQFTGRKDETGRPTPAHDGEAKAMRTYRMWTDVRWRLLVPNGDWLPGWPVHLAWMGGMLAGIAAAMLPMDPRVPGWGPAVNGVCAAVLVWQATGSRRRTAADMDPCPGVRLDALRGWAGDDRTGFWWNLAAAGALGSLPLAATWLLVPPSAFGLAGSWSRWVLAGCAGLAAAAGLLWPAWSKRSLTAWRDLVTTRAVWTPRWLAAGSKDESPVLVDHAMVGPLVVDTFDAPASQGAFAFTNQAATAKLLPAFGAGMRAWVLSCPNTDSMGQPVVGSSNPIRFRVVYCPSDQVPDLADPATTPEVAETVLEAGMATACDLAGCSRFLLVQAAALTVPPVPEPPVPPTAAARDLDDHHDDDGDEPDLDPDLVDDPPPAGSRYQVWGSRWLNPDGLPLSWLRINARDKVAAGFGMTALIDHRADGGAGVVYVGPATEQGVVFEPSTGVTAAAMEDLEREDEWRDRWAAVLKQGVNAPRPELGLYATEDLATRTRATIHCQPFVTLTGDEPESYFGLEAKLKATLQAAPFVAVTGFSRNGGRPGERHTQAFAVCWSAELVPSGPHELPPSRSPRANAPRWVLSGRMNEAFVAARLPRPEIADAACLTDARSRGHIWRIGLRLYGGVTLADVRGAAERIRGTLGSPWLRVAAAADGCVIYAGARPGQVRLTDPDDGQVLAALDWEQAWLDSKVSGVGGQLPKLTATGVLPHNEQVQVLDFALPSGLSLADVRAGVDKLKTATSNAFIEVREGVGGASTIRVLASEANPLPERAEVDFDVIDANPALAFSTGVEGEPVAYDFARDPHLLVVGGTGSGKSSTLQVLLYAAIAHGCDVYLADPTKGGADFRFSVPWLRAFTADVFEAAAMMDAVYKEVTRRKQLNAENGVGSYLELPEDLRPPHAIVVLDEFTSLMMTDPLPPKPDGDDPDEMAEYDHQVALNAAKRSIGSKSGRITREARSAGVTLVLATQRLTAKTLDAIPGASDLRTNMSRLLLGKATFGETQSALKDPQAVPPVGETVPPGRGVFEVSGDRTRLIQSWYTASITKVLAEHLAERRAPLDESQRLSLTAHEPGRRGRDSGRAEPGQGRVIDLGEVELSMADLELFFDEDEPVGQRDEPVVAVAPRRADAAVFVDVDGTVAPASAPKDWPDAALVDTPSGPTWVSRSMLRAIAGLGGQVVWLSSRGADAPAVLDPIGGVPSDDVLLDQSDERFGWWKTGAAAAWLVDHPQVRTVVWLDDQFGEEDELGISYGETADDVFDAHGVRHLLVASDPTVGLTADDLARAAGFLAPEAARTADPERRVPAAQEAHEPGEAPTTSPAGPAVMPKASPAPKRKVLADEW